MWQRPDVDRLIELVKHNNCLYDIRSINYFNRHKRIEAFENIWKEMQRKNPKLTLDQVKMKWKVLRTQFMAEQRQIAKCQRDGTLDTYKRKLWCFDQLSFLGEHKKNRNSKLNKEASDEYSETYYYDDDMVEILPESEMDAITNSSVSQTEEVRFELVEERSNSPVSILENTYHSEVQENYNTSEEEVETLLQKENDNSSDEEVETLTQREFDNSRAHIRTEEITNDKYSWLGELVVAQMENIDSEYQQDAAWQIQCLMRNWIVKTRNKRRRTHSESIASY